MEGQGTQKSQDNLQKEKQSWRIHFLFQNWLQNQDSNQDTVVWHKESHRSTEQNKSPNINPYTYGQLIFNKSAKIIQ